MFAFNIEILKKSFPNDVQTKGSHRVAGIHRTLLTKVLATTTQKSSGNGKDLHILIVINTGVATTR